MRSTVDPPFSQQGTKPLPEGGAPFAAQYDTWPRALQIKSDSPCLDQKIAQVKNIYSKDGGGSSTDTKVEKIREMLAASNELERKLEFLKRWFGNVENQLSQPIHVHSLDDEAFDHILNKHQELHQDIVNHTESVLSVIELCNMLDSESDIFPKLSLQSDPTGTTATSSSKISNTSTMDLSLLRNRCRTVGKRWDRITAQSQDRLVRINRAWDNCRKFLKSCEDFKDYIECFQNEIEMLQNQSSFSPSGNNSLSANSSIASKQISKSTDELIQQLSERRDEFNKSLGQLQAINEQYRILYHDAGVGISTVTSASLSKSSDSASEMGPRSGLRNKLDEINKLWNGVSIEFDEIETKLRRGLKQVEEFSQVRQTLMVWLMDLDIRIENIDKFSTSENLQDRLIQLKDIQRDVETHQGRIDYLNMIGQRLLSNFNGNGGSSSSSGRSQGDTGNLQMSFVESELKHFNKVADSIKERVSRLTQKLNPSKTTSPKRIGRGSFESTRGNSLESDSRNRDLGDLSPRSRALKQLELSAVANNNLLTSSTYDLQTSFSSGNTRGSSTRFRKSASLSALNRDRCLTGTTTATSGALERRPNADYQSSRSTRSTDRRSIGSSAPRSIVSEDFSVYFRNSSNSLFPQNAFDSESRDDFFAHRPQISSDHNDSFAKRHDQDVVSIHHSNGSQSGQSSAAKRQNDGFLNEFEWDPYEPLPSQRSIDHLIVRAPMSNSSSSTVNVDLNHNRSGDLPTYLLSAPDHLQYHPGSARSADPMKKTFTVKQKAVLLKFQPTMEDLKETLEECKACLDGSEAYLRCPTPSGEKCEIVKLTFSSNIAACKASVDVVKSIYNKLQAQEPGIFRQSAYKNLSASVEDCSQRWDVIKQRAMEKRRRLKHNYQLWNQFLKDVTELRHWIVQYSPTYPTSGHFKDPSIELRAPEDVGLEQFKRFMAVSKERSPMYHVKKRTLRLNSLEELIRSHTVFMKDLVGKKTSLISINMYWERYHSDDENRTPRAASPENAEEIDYNAEVKLLNTHFDILCKEALQTQLSLQDCIVHNEELNGGIADMILWVETVERAFEALQIKYNAKPPESIAAEVHAALLQLKSEVDTNQDTVEMIRCSAEQLLMFASQSSVLADSSSHSSSMRSKSSGLSSMSPYTEETSEVKERLYILCSRFRMLKKKVANSLELVEVNAKMVRSDSNYSWRRLLSVYSSSSAAASANPQNQTGNANDKSQNQLPLNDDNNNTHEPLPGLAQQKLGLDGAANSCQSLRDPPVPSRESAPIIEPLNITSNMQAGLAGPSTQNSHQDLTSADPQNVDLSEILVPFEQLQSCSVERVLASIEDWPFETLKKIDGLMFELLETSLLVPVTRDCPWLQGTAKKHHTPVEPEIEKVPQHWIVRGLLRAYSNLKFVHFLFMLFIFMLIYSRISFLPAVNVRTPNTLLGINLELNYPYGPPPF